MKRTIIFLVFFFLFQSLNAQRRFSKGFFVKNNGDTIHCQIQDVIDKQLTKFFTIKQDDSLMRYAPEEVKCFEYSDGRKFIGEHVEIIDISGQTRKQYVFLKCLVEGNLSLYVYESDDEMLYYLKQNNRLEYLPPPMSVELEKKDEIDNKYIDIVRQKIYQCEDAEHILSYLKYKEKRLVQLVSNYNNCLGEEDTYFYFPRKEVWNGFFVGTMAIPYIRYVEADFRFGVYREMQKIDQSRNYSSKMGVIFHYRKMITPEEDYDSYYQEYLINIVPYIAKYKFGERKIKPYVFAGAGLMFFYFEEERKNGKTTIYHEKKFAPLPEPSLNIGLGAVFQFNERNRLFTELVPTLTGVSLNFGFSHKLSD